MQSIRSRLLLPLILAACTAESGGAEEDRQPIGKADIIGECQPDSCEGQAAEGNCFCDASCLDFGDCCENVYAVCGDELPEPDCDDGTQLNPLCDQKPPCQAGEVAAIVNSCFSCVDSLTCAAPSEGCGDGSELSMFCDIPPVCPEGFEKAIINACFQCVDPATCEPV
jgi:hypothetical protein